MKMNESDRYSIIRATRGHLDILLPIYEEFLHYYHNRYGSLLRNIALEKRKIIEHLEAKLGSDESGVFLATIGSTTPQAVGFVLISSVSLQRVNSGIYAIKDLFVTPFHREKGVALRLIRNVCEYCRVKNTHSITLLTGKINIEAQRLYEKCGFIRDSTYQDQQNVKYEMMLS